MLNVTHLCHWNITIFQNNPWLHWCSCHILAWVLKFFHNKIGLLHSQTFPQYYIFSSVPSVAWVVQVNDIPIRHSHSYRVDGPDVSSTSATNLVCNICSQEGWSLTPCDKYLGFYLQIDVNLGGGIMIHPLKPICTVNSFAGPSPQCCRPCTSPYPMNSIRVTESFDTCCIISSLQVSHCTGT